MKVCSKCQEEKDESEFYSSTTGWCKQCRIKNNYQYYLRRTTEKPFRADRLIRAAKFRAKKSGLECTITAADIVIPDTCPILDIPIVINSDKRADNSPSIDRIDNSKGYTPDNVIVVSYRANKLKNDATLEELRMLVERYGHLSGT